MSPAPRSGTFARDTKETRVSVEVDLDGSGQASITCPVHFLGHMLEQIARHGRMDLRIVAEGDVEVDAHHTVEDVGIALGEALRAALGSAAGIARYGHARCPLDEALSDVTVDLSGRSYVVVNTPPLPERVGDLPTELFEDFVVALSRHLRANIHVNVLYGRNGHHMIEASFKALARALRVATRLVDPGGEVPSTKGTLS